MTFLELIEQVAKRTGVSRTSVRKVLEALAEEVTETVLSRENVVFFGFGKFYYVEVKSRDGDGKSFTRTKIRFRWSRRSMNKYGVTYEQEDEKTKTASKGAQCPKCGHVLKEDRHCDNCGTEPFEAKPVPKKGG